MDIMLLLCAMAKLALVRQNILNVVSIYLNTSCRLFTGKTYTMGTSMDTCDMTEDMGIIPRASFKLFEEISYRETQDNEYKYRISIQFLEIYGDDIRDLLAPPTPFTTNTTTKLVLRETTAGDVTVVGAHEEPVSTSEALMTQLRSGIRQRVTAVTNMNQESSRSHGIHFAVYLL